MFIVVGYELDESEPNIFGLYKTRKAAETRVEKMEAISEFTFLAIEEIGEGACDIPIRV